MKKYFISLALIFSVLLAAEDAWSYNDVIKGEIATQLVGNEQLKVTVSNVGGGIRYLRWRTFFYPTYNKDPMYQSIEDFNFAYSPSITSTVDDIDNDVDSNKYRYSYWGDPSNPDPQIGVGNYILTNTFDGLFHLDLNGLRDSTTYPISGTLPTDVEWYLWATDSIQAYNQQIHDFAINLVSGCKREYEAVTKIMDWIKNNMKYTEGYPEDALSIFQDPQHRGDCTGFARLPIAFLRSIGIPARYVVGITIDSLFCVPDTGGKERCKRWGRGYHAWFEVYYLNSGWTPYDGQKFYHFVNTYRIKMSQCIDEQYCDVRLRYSYIDPAPTLTFKDTSKTSVDTYDADLHFINTLPTPDSFIISDKIIPLTGIEEEPVANNELPNRFSLFQNYPNPFNPETIIEYTLPEGPKIVKLVIYNIIGQKVRTLVNEEKLLGIYRIHWDGTDNKGEEVASGIYFSRIEIGNFSEVKKMVLIK